ncbi:hypothetical protein T265_11634 [Opisthorchis viverrini]|uniref:Uncharacterized protein n=1 Tax=Opisthorchis viverrini TaxID=6198 RepID=A0A074ZWX0_OPIVI|nr:hypothetical protein T265_11634 [Opisthorchis viverrini]KER19649.1 hypothetical protein T265_11634 [Opisthorchis viverrini]
MSYGRESLRLCRKFSRWSLRLRNEKPESASSKGGPIEKKRQENNEDLVVTIAVRSDFKAKGVCRQR